MRISTDTSIGKHLVRLWLCIAKAAVHGAVSKLGAQVGQRIRELLNARLYPQEQLADREKISVSFVS